MLGFLLRLLYAEGGLLRLLLGDLTLRFDSLRQGEYTVEARDACGSISQTNVTTRAGGFAQAILQ